MTRTRPAFRRLKFSLAIALAAAGAAVLQIAAAQGQSQNWSARVTQSEIGGHVLGNPLANKKLVEYVSYTCPHCAAFETQSHDELRTKYVRGGSISVEVRNFVRDPVDLTAALLARCGGKAKFFDNHALFMRNQPTWLAKAEAADSATRERWYQGAFNDRLKNIASDMGFYALMKQRGIAVTQANICLADSEAQKQVVAMTNYAGKTVNIVGTPSFTLNGKLLDATHDWKTLEPQIAAR